MILWFKHWYVFRKFSKSVASGAPLFWDFLVIKSNVNALFKKRKRKKKGKSIKVSCVFPLLHHPLIKNKAISRALWMIFSLLSQCDWINIILHLCSITLRHPIISARWLRTDDDDDSHICISDTDGPLSYLVFEQHTSGGAAQYIQNFLSPWYQYVDCDYH